VTLIISVVEDQPGQSMKVTALVLGSGASRRLGRPKQLIEIDGEALIRRAARLASEVAPTVVVIAEESLRAQLIGVDVQIVVNKEADEGMASSIRAGVSACHGGVLITLCDQPRVTAAHLRTLVDARAPIAATAYRGIVGVPAFFAQQYRADLLALRGDGGARCLIDAHRDVVAAIPFEDAAIDIDSEADIREL
jgi:molybdenum cofactor cytidylyltransferase